MCWSVRCDYHFRTACLSKEIGSAIPDDHRSLHGCVAHHAFAGRQGWYADALGDGTLYQIGATVDDRLNPGRGV